MSNEIGGEIGDEIRDQIGDEKRGQKGDETGGQIERRAKGDKRGYAMTKVLTIFRPMSVARMIQKSNWNFNPNCD